MEEIRTTTKQLCDLIDDIINLTLDNQVDITEIRDCCRKLKSIILARKNDPINLYNEGMHIERIKFYVSCPNESDEYIYDAKQKRTIEFLKNQIIKKILDEDYIEINDNGNEISANIKILARNITAIN